MNAKARVFLILALPLLAGLALVAASGAMPAQGGAPTVVSYQGEVRVGGALYSDLGYFKFAVVNNAGTTTYWSNDGTSSGGDEPDVPVKLDVGQGLFSVLLGDTGLSGMDEPLTAAVFAQPERYLRVWFSPVDSGPFERLEPDTRIAAVPYALQAQKAADADTVDGLHANQLGGAHYQNVVVVAKSGGDYASVQSAINSITGAAADNPYLVWVAPGVYVEQVTLKAHVHLQGAGQEATIISSTASGSSFPPTVATLKLASDSSVRDLTVGSTGAGARNVAILATAGTTRTLVAEVTVRAQGAGTYNYALSLNGSGTGVTLQQVTALGENATGYNYGLCSYGGATATLRGGSFTARGGSEAVGIDNSGSGTMLQAEGVHALAENGSSLNSSLRNHSAAATLRGGSFTAQGGGSARGIYNYGSGAELEAQGVSALAENGTNFNFGLDTSEAATLRGGSFTGRGGTFGQGVNNTTGTLQAEGITALGEDGSTCIGLGNIEGTVTLRLGSFTGRDGTYVYGLYNYGNAATLEAESVSALGKAGITDNYGLFNAYNSTTNVTQSVLEGASGCVGQNSGTVTVSNSRLVGGAVYGAVTCVAVSRGGTFNASGCP